MVRRRRGPRTTTVVMMAIVIALGLLCLAANVTGTCLPLLDCLGDDDAPGVVHVRNQSERQVLLRFDNADPSHSTTIEVKPGITQAVPSRGCRSEAVVLLDEKGQTELARLPGPMCRVVTWTVTAQGPPTLTEGYP